jgi:hypothetical protein
MSDRAGSRTLPEGKKKSGPLSKIFSIFKHRDSKIPPQQEEVDVAKPK